MLNALVAAAILGFTAQTAVPATRTIDIVGTDNMKYSVDRIEAKPGETLRIVLTTKSALPKAAMAHNVVVLVKGVNAAKFNEASASHFASDFIPPDRKGDILAATGLAGGGETVEVTFTVPKQTGNYDYLCTFPGHFRMGMKGVLVVK